MGKNRYHAPAVRQAVQIVQLLCESKSMLSLAEISRSLKLNKNTVHRILRTLAHAGWVRVLEPGPCYDMTLEPFRVTSQPLQRTSLREAAFSHLHALWQDIDETIYLAIPHDDKVLHVMYFESTQDVRVCGRIGVEYPIPGGVAASIFLAYAGQRDFARMTKGKGVPSKKLKSAGEAIRKRKWAMENSQLKDIRALGVPIFDHSGRCIAVAAIMALESRCSATQLRDTYSPKLVRAGESISQELGYAGSARTRD